MIRVNSSYYSEVFKVEFKIIEIYQIVDEKCYIAVAEILGDIDSKFIPMFKKHEGSKKLLWNGCFDIPLRFLEEMNLTLIH